VLARCQRDAAALEDIDYQNKQNKSTNYVEFQGFYFDI
jgi:hypothetical protein